MFGLISTLATFATAIGAAVLGYSFWWTALPAFVAASLGVANGPSFEVVMKANREERLDVMPRMIGVGMAIRLAFAGILFWIVGLFV